MLCGMTTAFVRIGGGDFRGARISNGGSDRSLCGPGSELCRASRIQCCESSGMQILSLVWGILAILGLELRSFLASVL